MATPADIVRLLCSVADQGSVVEQVFRAGQALRWHEHDDAYLSLVVSGWYREVSGCRSLYCAPDTAVFHPAGESHRDEFGAVGGRVINLMLPEPVIRGVLGMDTPLRTPRAFTGGPVPFLLSSLARVARRGRPGWRTTAHELVTELVGEISASGPTASAKRPLWLDSALALIRASFRRPIGLAEVSRAVRVHPAHVAREFRRHVRASVGEYVRSRRIAWACAELTRGRLPLVRIAVEAGFFDQAHFCRTFRRECGVPPSQFRRSLRAVDLTASAH